MKVKRVKGQGQKWKKGHSCVSNPSVTKHREAAKNRFFQRLEGESGLTTDALAKHDAELSGVAKEMGALSVDEEDLQSAGKTFNTFATNFTTCTLPAFNKFFQTFNVNSEHQTRMLAIHAAAQEYIKEQNMPETSTSFYCALVMSMEGMLENEEDVAATLSLMVRIIKRVPMDVLKLKFGSFAKTLDMCITKHSESSNVPLLTNLIGCLSVLLRAQDKVQWTYPYTMSLFQKILAFTTHEKPKIRKSAQYNTSAILKGSAFIVSEECTHSIHPASSNSAEFCIAQLRSSSEMGHTKTMLHILVLLRQIITTFPKKQLKVICETILSVMQLGSSLLNTCCLQTLYALLVSEPPASLLPAETNVALINALSFGTVEAYSGGVKEKAGVMPSMNDAQPCAAWITVHTVAHINLFKLNVDMGMNQMALWFQRLVSYWQSQEDEVQLKVYESLEALLEECITTMDQSTLKTYNSLLLSMFKSVESALSFQYQPAWGHVFTTLAKLFQVLGPHLGEEMLDCLRSLTELMDNEELPQRGKLEHAIGSAIQGLGPKAVVSVVPLQITGAMKEDEKYFWILPLMRKYVKGTQLTFYEDFFVHLAGKCFVLINSLKEKNQGDGLLVKTYQTVEQQIWSLLPSFCNEATDVEAAMSNEKFARILCDHIKFRDDTRLHVMAALRAMIEGNLENPGRLAIYGKNYLPALFNVYLCTPKKMQAEGGEGPFIENGQRLAAYATIKIYLKILPQPRRNEFLSLIMTKYNDEKSFIKRQALLDIARAFLPYLESSLLQRLYNKVSPLLEQSKEKKEQKSVYRLLEELLALENTEAANFVTNNIDSLADVFLKSLSSAAPNAKAPRLRCVRYILRQLKTEMEEDKKSLFLNQVVAESVMCCSGKHSEATRKAAFQLLQELGTTVQRLYNSTLDDTLRHCLKLLLAGLVGSPTLAANTILAVTSLMYQFKDIMRGDILELLMQNMCIQLVCQSREIVGACLSFIRSALVVIPTPIMADHLDTVVQALCNMTPDCQRKYRQKTRDIYARLMRKFGEDSIIGLVPQEDKILHKRLRNLRKLAARKKQENEKGDDNGDDDEDEDGINSALPASLDEILAEIDADVEDDEDEEGASKKKNKKRNKKIQKVTTVIREGGEDDDIFDLLDPSAGQSVVSQRPTLKAKGSRKNDDGGFKVDSAGRFIITEEEGKGETSKRVEHMEDVEEMLAMKSGAQEGKIKKRKRTLSDGSFEMPDLATAKKSSLTQKGEDSSGKNKNKKPKFAYGTEFRSKSAGGDMMKKGKVQPYAYVQLSKDRLNKRKKAKFAGQFNSLIHGAKKGVRKGTKMKARSKK
ncbi:RRP12-like protein [Oratosquilla oratoria]|uniref:RRP12-like protein n=1 Tax=Oratosquilla oratoria TaxID=337810 RepID=UPI003F760E6E